MRYFLKLLPLIIVLLLILPPSATADWINLTGAENAPNIAEIFIENDHVKVLLEVQVKDLVIFEELIPNDFFPELIPGRPSADDRLRVFSENVLQIIADGEKRLHASLNLAEPRMRKPRYSPFAGAINPATGRPVPGPPEDKRVLYAELLYPLDGQKPSTLNFIPPLNEEGTNVTSIGFIVFHQDVPIIDFRFLPESALLHLDWEDSWYSGFENKALKRWQRGSVMSFLYIEPYEVRHEVLARVKDLEAWMDLGLRGDEFIEEDEFLPLLKRAGEFLMTRNKVLIDGQPVKPILDRTAFVKYNFWGSQFLTQPERLPIQTSMLGVIFTYLTGENLPGEVTVDWELFSDRVKQVPTSATDPAGPFPSYVTPDDTIFRWTNYLKTYTPPQVVQVDVSSIHTFMSPCLLQLPWLLR
jgi:hypothetical protein